VIRGIGHMLRNAMVHGIEDPATRGEKGEVGTIEVGLTESDTAYELFVTDDGAGIDGDALASIAVRSGVLSRAEADALGADEKLQLVFLDGLSTTRQVDQVTGRGLGLPSVREAVEALGGSIRIRSERARGTRFEMTLPKRRISAPRVGATKTVPPRPEAPPETYDAQFIIASGPEDAHRATLGLASALAAASSGINVVCFFTMRGAMWTGDVDPQELPVPGFDRVKTFIAALVEEGVRMEACASCVESNLDAPRDASGRKQLASGFVLAGLPEATIRMMTTRSAVF
jgi:predicted peroxiredoxin